VLAQVQFRFVEYDPAARAAGIEIKRTADRNAKTARGARMPWSRPRMGVERTIEDLPDHVGG
jgi:hypothetical protein